MGLVVRLLTDLKFLKMCMYMGFFPYESFLHVSVFGYYLSPVYDSTWNSRHQKHVSTTQ